MLGVIASKLGAEAFGYELLTPLQSLLIVIFVLGAGIGASLLTTNKKIEGS